MKCPKCQGRIFVEDDEMNCMNCGLLTFKGGSMNSTEARLEVESDRRPGRRRIFGNERRYRG